LDRDGLNDLVVMDHEGFLAYFHRIGKRDELRLEPGKRIFFDADGQPLQLNAERAGRSGRRKLCLADWNGDGRLDLLTNSKNVDFWENISNDERGWRFKNRGTLDERVLAGHTTSPTVVDWNRDGLPDLLVGGEDGHFYYMKNPRSRK
jgi:hypothetical protein